MEISTERHGINGITLSAIVDGYLVSTLYVGYTLKEAKQKFRAQYGKEIA